MLSILYAIIAEKIIIKHIFIYKLFWHNDCDNN